MGRKWAGSNRRAELPPDWEQRRLATAQKAGWQCEAMSQIEDDGTEYGEGIRCWRRGTDCDHNGDRHDHDDLKWLCSLHHRNKTQRQALEARRSYGPAKRPPEPHPGRIR